MKTFVSFGTYRTLDNTIMNLARYRLQSVLTYAREVCSFWCHISVRWNASNIQHRPRAVTRLGGRMMTTRADKTIFAVKRAGSSTLISMRERERTQKWKLAARIQTLIQPARFHPFDHETCSVKNCFLTSKARSRERGVAYFMSSLLRW